MTERRPYSRTGLHALKARVKLRGFNAIDRRTAVARQTLAFRRELIAALGGEKQLSPQRLRVVELVARAALFLDHLDGFLVEQKSLVNHRSRSVIPALLQRQAIADHLAKLLDKLGLDCVPEPEQTLEEYLRERYGHKDATRPEPEPEKDAP